MKKLISILLVVSMVSAFTVSIGSFAEEENLLTNAQSDLLLNQENEKNTFWDSTKSKVKYGYEFTWNKTKYGANLAWNKMKPVYNLALNKTKYGAEFAWNETKYGASLAWNKTKDLKEITLKALNGDPISISALLMTLAASTIFGMKICKLCKSAASVKNMGETSNKDELNQENKHENETPIVTEQKENNDLLKDEISPENKEEETLPEINEEETQSELQFNEEENSDDSE